MKKQVWPRCRVVAVLTVLLLLGLAQRVSATGLLDPTPRIAVVSAFEPEWTSLKAELVEPKEYKVNGRSYLTGRLAGKDVVLFLSGISMVNAAMNTQIGLDRFTVTSVLFSGIAGGVDPALHIGDVVIADQWGQYLESVFARETTSGFAIPPWMEKSEYAGYGMMMPRRVEVTRKDMAAESRFWFPSDPALLAAALRVAARIDLTDCVEANKCLIHKPRIVVGGNGVSGQAFVDNAKFRDYVLATFQAKVLDMESAAVAQVTFANGVPFLAVRSLSDLAGGGEGANEMMTFMGLASKNSAAVVMAILKEMP
ncbi:5'-methylthioadenosine/S-adenosylhomocysteine nucleosidase [Taklimakanibacter lacteus]|uniref:5'-methylthioadenosine/S-adenosylhomocysteine nucleosidase n=1 Tax=Taklimakanibacter lacteus TaxID=2268456 RepID=UPI000E66691C